MTFLNSLLLASLVLSFSQAHAYYSKDSYEGTVTFKGVVEIEPLYSDQNVLEFSIPPQLDFLAGSMQPEWEELYRDSSVAQKSASPKKDHQITLLRRFKDPETNKMLAEYQYTGTFVIGNKIQNSLPIRLPYDSGNIIPNADDACFMLGGAYRNSYYWNPKRKGCNMVEGKDYYSVQGSITQLANTTATFPRYENLTNNGELRVILAFGADEDSLGYLPPGTVAPVPRSHDPKDEKNVVNRADYNAKAYLETRAFLTTQGFSAPVSVTQSVREQECGSSFGRASGFVEEFTRKDGDRKVTVRMFWGVASLGDESRAFYCTIKRGVEDGSVMLYSGHSRVGLLTVEYVSQLLGQNIRAPSPTRYQIFGFLGCSSYGHYTVSYFKAKSSAGDPTGMQNADILSNGVFGNFDALADMNTKTIGPILQWSKSGTKTSWQQIINSYKNTYLTGVNGDE